LRALRVHVFKVIHSVITLNIDYAIKVDQSVILSWLMRGRAVANGYIRMKETFPISASLLQMVI
jgi:hypothetical protein